MDWHDTMIEPVIFTSVFSLSFFYTIATGLNRQNQVFLLPIRNPCPGFLSSQFSLGKKGKGLRVCVGIIGMKSIGDFCSTNWTVTMPI